MDINEEMIKTILRQSKVKEWGVWLKGGVLEIGIKGHPKDDVINDIVNSVLEKAILQTEDVHVEVRHCNDFINLAFHPSLDDDPLASLSLKEQADHLSHIVECATRGAIVFPDKIDMKSIAIEGTKVVVKSSFDRNDIGRHIISKRYAILTYERSKGLFELFPFL